MVFQDLLLSNCVCLFVSWIKTQSNPCCCLNATRLRILRFGREEVSELRKKKAWQLHSLIANSIWMLWLNRSDSLFCNHLSCPSSLWCRGAARTNDYCGNKDISKGNPRGTNAPSILDEDDGEYTIDCDGSFSQFSSLAGVGYVAKDRRGEIMAVGCARCNVDNSKQVWCTAKLEGLVKREGMETCTH